MFKLIWSFLAPASILAACYISEAPLLITIASMVGVFFVLGVAYKLSWANLLGAALTLIYSYLSFEAGYNMNGWLNLLLLFPLQLSAFWYWRKTGNRTFSLSKKKLKIILPVTVASMLVSCGLSYQMGSNLWVHDGVSSVLVILATLLLMAKVKEQWYAWIPYNFIEVLMWFAAASLAPEVLAIFVMRVVFFANSLIGYYEWNVRKA